jgi:exonuclease-1
MGIQGLLPQLKSIMAPIGVAELRGQTVAVDTYSWLHKGALSCGDRLCKGIPTTRFPSHTLFLGPRKEQF